MFKKSTWLAVLVIFGLVTILPVTHAQVNDLAQNGSFEEDEVILDDPAWDQWVTWGYDTGLGGTVAIDTNEFIDGTRSLRVMPQGGTNWYFEVINMPIPMKVGTNYTASFWAKAEEPRPLTVHYKDTGNSTTGIVESDFQLTTEWAEYSFTAAAPSATVKVEFLCAASEVPFWLDFFVLYEGEYVSGIKPSGASRAKSAGPSPAANALDVPRDGILSWKPGEFAGTHDVYFGTSFDDVNNAGRTSPLLVSKGQGANTYDPAGLLEFGKTYYWRIDEVNAPPTDSTLFKGDTWSFTTETYGYPITMPIVATASSFSNPLNKPDKTIDGSGLTNDQHSTSASQMWLSKKNVTPIWIQYEFDRVYKLHQMWVWNQNQMTELDNGMGAKEVTVECSTDGTTWTALANVPEFAQAPGEDTYEHNTTVDFGGALAKYVKLTIHTNWADGNKQAGLSEVRFFYVPVKAFGPTPTIGATDVALNGVLNWRPGREAAKHELSLGKDPNALAPVQTLTEHTYALGSAGLEYGRTYYWKVNEVNDAATPSSWTGDVWSFTPVGYAVVEDFESYDDLCNRIFWTWMDQYGYNSTAECGGGFPGNGSGSTVGNPQPPYAERLIVHSGRQSLPFWYDNTKSPYYSETQREWVIPQTWTGGGANTLRMYLYGDAAAFIETSPGTLIMNGTGTDIWNTTDEFRFVYKTLKGNGSLTAKVESVTNTHANAKAGVMIRDTLDGASLYAMTDVTPGAGIEFLRRVEAAGVSTSTVQAALVAPYWVRITRTGNTFKAERSADGVTWVAITTDAAASSETITMANEVYIGLAVTSHAAGVVCGAKYSNVSTTGGVSGSWQVGEIGVPQATTGNMPETCYVAVQDLGGKLKVVSTLDPSVIATGVWEEWNIPLSQFTSAGVNLSNVRKLIIGIGDRNAPKAGSAGKLYIDDIRLTRVATP